MCFKFISLPPIVFQQLALSRPSFFFFFFFSGTLSLSLALILFRHSTSFSRLPVLLRPSTPPLPLPAPRLVLHQRVQQRRGRRRRIHRHRRQRVSDRPELPGRIPAQLRGSPGRPLQRPGDRLRDFQRCVCVHAGKGRAEVTL